MRDDKDDISKQGRLAALVIAGAMSGWIFMQWLGPRVSLDGKFAILIDLMVLAALFWALVVVYQVWKRRQ